MQQLQIGPGASECGSALRSLRLAKSFWSLLIILAILIHLAAFVMVEFVGVLDEAKGGEKKKAKPAATKPAKPAKAKEPTEAEEETAPGKIVNTVMSEAMPIAKLIAPLACAMLTIILFVVVMAALSERAGGAASFVSAFLWSLILLAMLTPWQNILTDLRIFGALYDGGLADISTAKRTIFTSDLADKILYYGRFIAYPVIALLVWVLVQWKFGRGFGASQATPEVSVMRPDQA